jgi:CDP-6-deoxy-D-xylo-4-hexulose-3-dehydrase
VQQLEASGIQTRMLFAGNILRHPLFDDIRASGRGYRVIGELTGADRILQNTFWLGVYPGMKEGMLSYVIERVREFA